MSGMGSGGGNGGGSKKAVHVKWAGKTIALGTFPQGEAEDKCARAKALTRAWRSTMRPKPTREWVMLELERLGVRVVSGRLGRGKDEEDGDDVSDEGDKKNTLDNGLGVGNNNLLGGNNNMMGMNNNMGMGNMMGMMGMNNNNNNMGMGSVDNTGSSNFRPLVGGGAAAAFNAARDDHYRQIEEKKKNDDMSTSQNDMSSMAGLGGNNMASGMGMNNMPNNTGNGGNTNMPSFGVSVNPNQHYEMLKLHHMNLLNEIQETTLMMNLYQQQQLQQQQQQQQQMRNIGGGMGMGMMNNGGMMNSQSSTGLGSLGEDSKSDLPSISTGSINTLSPGKVSGDKTDDEKAALLKKLKDDILAREREAAELEESMGPKRKTGDADDGQREMKKARGEAEA